MIQRILHHRDARSTERYAKLDDLALVELIRPKTRRLQPQNVDPMWIRGDSGSANRSETDGIWRGGRDSNPQFGRVRFRGNRYLTA